MSAIDEGQDEQDDADDPVELARVLVGAEEEGPRHVQEDEDHHHRRAPLVHAAHELAEEGLVGDVARRLVGPGGRRVVVHGQEDAGDRLVEEGEHRRRAQRVEPVGPLGDLAEHHPPRGARQRRALVDPVDGGDRPPRRRCRAASVLPLPSPGRLGAGFSFGGGGSGSLGMRLGPRHLADGRARRIEVLADAVQRLGGVARREALELAG